MSGWDLVEHINDGCKTAAARRIIQKRSGYRSAGGPAAQCAMYFQTSAPQIMDYESPSRFNFHKMAREFRVMMDSGSSAEHIRDMVDQFWTGSYSRKLPKPAYYDFLDSRAVLHQQVNQARGQAGLVPTR